MPKSHCRSSYKCPKSKASLGCEGPHAILNFQKSPKAHKSGFQQGFQRRKGVPARFQQRVLAHKGFPARGSTRDSSTFVPPLFPCFSARMPLLAPWVDWAKAARATVGTRGYAGPDGLGCTDLAAHPNTKFEPGGCIWFPSCNNPWRRNPPAKRMQKRGSGTQRVGTKVAERGL